VFVGIADPIVYVGVVEKGSAVVQLSVEGVQVVVSHKGFSCTVLSHENEFFGCQFVKICFKNMVLVKK
jgi:hypothetical protein